MDSRFELSPSFMLFLNDFLFSFDIGSSSAPVVALGLEFESALKSGTLSDATITDFMDAATSFQCCNPDTHRCISLLDVALKLHQKIMGKKLNKKKKIQKILIKY